MSVAKTIIPISCIHKVTIARIAAGIRPDNKNGAMVLTSKPDAGVDGEPTVIDVDNRVVSYNSKPDFAAEWDSSCPVYDDVCKKFAEGASPVHVGFYDDAEDVAAALLEIIECEPNFYGLTTPDMCDDQRQVDVGDIIDQFDPNFAYFANTKLCPDEAGAIHPAMMAAGLCNTALQYHDQGCDSSAELSGLVSTFNFDAGSPPNLFGYPATGSCPPVTLENAKTKFNELRAANINMKVCVGNSRDSRAVWIAGKTIKGDRIKDCVLACWLQARTQEALFNVDLNNGAPDYTEFGYFQKINTVSSIFRTAQERKLITGDRFNEAADRERGYVINAPAYADIPAGQFTSGEPFCITVSTYSPGAQEGSCVDIKLFL